MEVIVSLVNTVKQVQLIPLIVTLDTTVLITCWLLLLWNVWLAFIALVMQLFLIRLMVWLETFVLLVIIVQKVQLVHYLARLGHILVPEELLTHQIVPLVSQDIIVRKSDYPYQLVLVLQVTIALVVNPMLNLLNINAQSDIIAQLDQFNQYLALLVNIPVKLNLPLAPFALLATTVQIIITPKCVIKVTIAQEMI